MISQGWLQIAIIIISIAIFSPLVGKYIAHVFSDEKTRSDKIFGPIEKIIYKTTGVNPDREQRWQIYARSLIAFSTLSIVLLYFLQRFQNHLPLNPTHAKSVSPALAFNAAVSFVTNTNWQNYGGELTMSHFTQMIGLTTQNFLSAAVGIAVAITLIRGLIREKSDTIGNFWVDITRATVRILLPIAFVFALIFVSQGMIQNFHGFHNIHTIAHSTQRIPGGPVASQESIKELGTNVGGFYNANAAHPFENPNSLTNLLEIFLLLMLPFGLAASVGFFTKQWRQGVAVFSVMFILWFGAGLLTMHFESQANPRFDAAHVTRSQGNMEGKEQRFGATSSGLFAASTTGTSTGSVNSSHDSFTPAGGAVVLSNIMLGEVSPGGTGSGLYGMLIFVLLSVFIAGLMVGRTPEYLGKKIQAAEMKLSMLYILAVPFVVLTFVGISVVITQGTSSRLNTGPHGLTEIVYGFVSTGNNNGSAFGGLTGNTPWYNITFAISMLVGRFALMIPVLAIAGSLGKKTRVPKSAGTFPTDSPLFVSLVIGVVLIVVGLTYFPILALGPIVEHLGL